MRFFSIIFSATPRSIRDGTSRHPFPAYPNCAILTPDEVRTFRVGAKIERGMGGEMKGGKNRYTCAGLL